MFTSEQYLYVAILLIILYGDFKIVLCKLGFSEIFEKIVSEIGSALKYRFHIHLG